MPVIVGLLLGLVAADGWVDYLTGLELSVSFLYLIPIALGTWVAGRSIGNVVALASAGVWLCADFLERHTYGHWFSPVWNTLTLAISFLVVGDSAADHGNPRRFNSINEPQRRWRAGHSAIHN
jgi:hypothetical protein